MPRRCCVPGCKTNYDSVLKADNGRCTTTFKFPTNVVLRNQWIQAIPRQNWTPSQGSAVCCKHFKEEDIVRFDIYQLEDKSIQKLLLRAPRLNPGAVPSVFPVLLSYSSNVREVERISPDQRPRKIKSSMTKVPSPTVIGDTSNADEVISICTDATFQDADVGTSLLSEIKEEILECEESSLTPEITMREGIETVYLSSNSEIKNFLPEDDHQPEPFQHRESISKTQQKANISVKPMSKLKVRKTSDLLSPSVLKSQEKKNIEILKSKTINTRGRLRLHDNKPLLIMDANHLKDFDYKINCVEKTPVFVLHSNVVIPVSVFQDTNFINAVKSGLIKVVTFNVLCEFLLSI